VSSRRNKMLVFDKTSVIYFLTFVPLSSKLQANSQECVRWCFVFGESDAARRQLYGFDRLNTLPISRLLASFLTSDIITTTPR